MSSALVIIAPTGYQDKELDGTLKGLKNGGFDVIIGSTEIGPCTGKFGGTTEATVALRDVIAADYDRIAFIGGPGAHQLTDNIDAHRVAREAVDMHMPLGAICIAPTVLAAAGVLKGRNATVWDDGEGTQIEMLRRGGATYSGEPVTVDGLIITGNGPDAAEAFGQKMAMIGEG
jgi:protease I